MPKRGKKFDLDGVEIQVVEDATIDLNPDINIFYVRQPDAEVTQTYALFEKDKYYSLIEEKEFTDLAGLNFHAGNIPALENNVDRVRDIIIFFNKVKSVSKTETILQCTRTVLVCYNNEVEAFSNAFNELPLTNLFPSYNKS